MTELFLVATGATDSLVPKSHLEAIGLESKGLRGYETADGRNIKVDVTTADIEFMGDFTAGRIIMGDEDAEPRLGVTAFGVRRHRSRSGRSAVAAQGG